MGVVVRQSIKASIVNYLGIAVGFVVILILMPLIFSEKEVGIVRMLIENHIAFAGLAVVGVSSSLIRYYPMFKTEVQGKNHGMDFWALLIPLFGTVLVSILLLLAKNWIASMMMENAAAFMEYYLLFIPLIFSQVYFSVLEATASVEGRIAIPKLIKEVVLRVFSIIAFLAYMFGYLTFDQSVLLLVAFYFLHFLILFFYVLKLRKLDLKPDFVFLRNNPAIVKDFWKYTGYITIGSISGLMITKLDFFMISSIKGLAFTGVYAIAFHCATIIEIPKRALVQILSPPLAVNMANAKIRDTAKLYKRTAILQFLPALFLLLGLLINLDNLYKIMPNGKLYEGGKLVIAVIAIAKTIEMIFGLGTQILTYSKYYHYMFVLTISSAIIGIVLNLWLIPIWGIIGAAVATGLVLVYQQIIVYFTILFKLKFHPFSMPLLWLSLIFIVVLGLNFLLPPFSNPWVDASIRSILFPGLFLALVLYFNLSPDIQKLLKDIWNRVKVGNFKTH
jgi:O-antigen/teichoic acid export membrane protein